MIKTFLIGLAGRARSGKDTVASMITDQLRADHGERKGGMLVSFADPIKNMIDAGFHPITDQYTGLKESPIPGIGKSLRELYQTLGTEWGRQMVHPDIWVTLAMSEVNHYIQRMPVIITDVRFENEAQAIRERGGHLWHIERPNAPAANTHISEQQQLMQPGDTIIDNSGTLADLRAVVDRQLGLIQ